MLHSLTSLRFFCAFYVFLFHVEIRHPFAPLWLKPVIDDGYAGMSFFFILSGFVLTVRYHDENFSWRNFAVARFRRIYPAFAIAFLLSLFSLASLSAQAFLLNTAINVLLLQAWFPNLFAIGLNGGTWSLSVESFFYALFPYLLALLRPIESSRGLLICAASAWIFSFLPGVVEYAFPSAGNMLFYYSSPPYRLAEFVFGIVTAISWRKGVLRVSLAPLGMLCAIYVASTFIFRGMAGPNMSLLNLTSVPAVCGLIIYSAQRRPALLESALLVFLGNISYGFYIYQFLFFQSILPRLQMHGASPSVILFAGFMTTTAIAFASFRFFEAPMKRFLTNWFSSAR